MKDSRGGTVHPFLYLLVGAFFLFFFNGRWILPIAAFVAPIFIIRFLRLQPTLRGFLITVAMIWVVNVFVWSGMMPVGGIFYYLISLMMSIFTTLVFLIDRIYSERVKGFLSTMIFPSAYVVMDYIVISTNPSGSYGTLAHTQTVSSLIQMISLTGIWGLSFIIMWTASIVNWLWDNEYGKNSLKQALVFFGIPVLLLIMYGQVRTGHKISGNTVRIASIATNKADAKDWNHNSSATLNKMINDAFLKNSETAAVSGAKIVFGTETVVKLMDSTESDFIDAAGVIAKRSHIYLGIPMELRLARSPEKPAENKITWVSPAGDILITYHKTKATHPGEGSYGDGIIKYFDSPYGRIGSAICFDMDFPSVINQVGPMNIDIMVVPGNDWIEISPYHTRVASFRAIEHGFNLVRGASNGLSASYNFKGELLSSMDYFTTDDLIFYSDVPTRGEKTLYSMMGDYFAWACIVFLMAVIIFEASRTRV